VNGKPDTPVAVRHLDYREVARPLTFRMIKEDLDALFAAGAPEPKKIILWEHQMDWLVKAERGGQPLEDLNASLGDFFYAGRRVGGSFAAAFAAPRPAIWGIPVEYHAPLTEADVKKAIHTVNSGGMASGHFTYEWNPYQARRK
jgi:hypothetical protein